MYHRFNEFKYPSTNISMDVFKKHVELILNANLTFYHPKDFVNEFDIPKKEKRILLTVDDAFQSFYDNAWPYLKKNQIPFVLFVSTEPVGNKGYMNWEQIKEIESSEFGVIGHHSHSHDYLIDKSEDVFLDDIKSSNRIFKEKLGYVPTLFSYPFGEYSGFMKDYISRNFKIAFGQHSGIIDVNKNRFELPRFPINEKYGEIKRFKSIINYFPLEYKNLEPKEKKLSKKNNPPKFKVRFFDNQKNIENISCYSNEGDKWMKSKIKLVEKELTIEFREPFLPRRGRINCSVNDNGKWRWFGTQFIIR
ncbi:polysaccharide deacetylase family protein [Candidatus Pelagibacter sp.]|uniref:polysaccharide deacetylase family protein n=1 Tax=Candidatus Pelagibacter sp. TaxID=2024849 RepID=UPI003F8432B5